MFKDEKTNTHLMESSLADLLQQPGYTLQKPKLTLDFSKPVVEQRLSTSFSGGNPDGQLVVYKLWQLDCKSPDIDLDSYLKKWIERSLTHAPILLKDKLQVTASGMLSKLIKLLSLLASYPNKA